MKKLVTLLEKYPHLIHDTASTSKQRIQAKLLLATWLDVFCKNVRDMQATDLMKHKIRIYDNATPRMANSMLYTEKEIKWQRENLP